MRKLSVIFIILISILTASCTKKNFTGSYWVMDTYCTVTLYDNVSAETNNLVSDILKSCEESLLLKDNSKSFFAEQDNHEIPIQQDIYEMLQICLFISELSDGKFDISIAPLTKLWDIQNRTKPPTETEIFEAKNFVGYKYIELNPEALTIKKQNFGIDLGAAGKGYSGDRTAEILQENGYSSGLLNLGGNITVFGENPNKDDGTFVIGIKDPVNTSNVYASVKTKNTNIVTAGAYERYFEFNGKTYHHIIDPQTGYPSDSGLLSVTVICKNGTVADTAATALYLIGEEKSVDFLDELRKCYPDIGAVLYKDNGDVITYNIESYSFTTYDFKGEIIYND